MMIIVLDTFVVFTECQVLFEALYIYYQVRQSEKASSLFHRKDRSCFPHTHASWPLILNQKKLHKGSPYEEAASAKVLGWK